MSTHLKELCQTLLTQLRVRDFTSPEHARDFDLVAFLEEPEGFAHVGFKIVLRNSRANLYTLNFLLFALLVLAELALVVFVLSVIDDTADRRLGGRAHHNQIEASFSSTVQSVAALHNAKLAAILIDDPDFPVAEDTVIDLGARFRAWRSSKSWYFRSPRQSA